MIDTGQPHAGELRALAEQGIRSVVDLRQEGERYQTLSPGQERQASETAGMAYAHHPVPTDKLDRDLLARFHREVSRLPKPIVVHCAPGKQSGSLAFIHNAINRGLNGHQALGRVERPGVPCGPQGIREEIWAFVDQQRDGNPA